MIRLLTIMLIVVYAFSAYARVDVRSLSEPKPLYSLKLKYMYAIGREDQTGNAVTVANGRVYVSKVGAAGAVTVTDSMKTVTSSLVFTHVKHWTEAKLAGETRTLSNLGPFMNTVLKKTGYELAGVFPFLIKGTFDEIEVEKALRKKVTGLVVGFLTKTFPPDRAPVKLTLEMHFLDDGGKYLGNVADLKLTAENKAALFLPE